MRLDEKNGLLVSGGWDSAIIVQRQVGQRVINDEMNNFKEPLDDSFADKGTEEIPKTVIMKQIRDSHYAHEI